MNPQFPSPPTVAGTGSPNMEYVLLIGGAALLIATMGKTGLLVVGGIVGLFLYSASQFH